MERESYTRSEIFELLSTEPATKVAQRIGLSDVAIGKWCKQYGVSKPPLGYWAKLEHGKIAAEKPPLEPWWNEHDPLIYVRTSSPPILTYKPLNIGIYTSETTIPTSLLITKSVIDLSYLASK